MFYVGNVAGGIYNVNGQDENEHVCSFTRL